MKPPTFEKCPDFLSKPSVPLKYLVTQLLPAATMVLLHGDPRTRKSYTALELAIACATGCAAFGMPRFRSTQGRVLYLSQEDPAHVVRERVRSILDDKELDPPANLSLGIHQGIDLDHTISREYLWSSVKANLFDLIIIDPIRRFTAFADRGPSEVTPITTFFRRFCVELGSCIMIIHHDTKPFLINGADARKNGYKASGGDWFASCECPIYFQSNGDEWTHVIPDSYKLSDSPEPFDVSVTSDPDTGRVHIYGRDNTTAVREDRIVQFLIENPDSSFNSIVSHCRIKREEVKPILMNLQDRGLVSMKEGPRNSTLWSI